jgi:hypothetical protein
VRKFIDCTASPKKNKNKKMGIKYFNFLSNKNRSFIPIMIFKVSVDKLKYLSYKSIKWNIEK